MENVQGISGEQKKEVAVYIVKGIYKQVNPNIPLIPEPFESWMEDLLLDQALNEFVDFMIDTFKEKRVFG